MYMDINIDVLAKRTQNQVHKMREKFFQDTEEAVTNKEVIERAVSEYYSRYRLKKIIARAKRPKRG